MKTFIVIAVLAISCYIQQSEGLTCTDSTDKTCKASLFTTGTCSSTSDECECKSGSVPSTYGCQEPIEVTLSLTTVYDSVPVPASGDAIAGGAFKFTCSPSTKTGKYKWFKNNNPISGQTKNTYEINSYDDSDNKGPYTCSLTVNGIESSKSNAVELKLIDSNDAADYKKPVVKGVPGKAFVGQKFSISCENLPTAITGRTNSISIDGTEEKVRTKTHTVKTGTTSGIVCSSDNAGNSAKVSSDEVEYPTIVTDISAVKISGPSTIVVGKRATFKCLIDDDELAALGTIATYKWSKDGKEIDSETSVEYIISRGADEHKGSYTCKITVDGEFKSSPAFPVTTASISHKAVASTKKTLVGGYANIACEVENADGLTIVYGWIVDSKVILGFTDQVLQLNAIKTADKKVKCTAKVGEVELDESNEVLTDDATDLANVEATLEADKNTFLLNEKYTLTCDSPDYKTPGLSYKWTEDSTIDGKNTGPTKEVTATATSTEHKCEVQLDTTDSKPKTLTIKGEVIGEVKLHFNGEPVSSIISVLKDSKVTLQCQPQVAPGGNDTAEYEWKKGSTTESNTESSFEFDAETATIECKVTVGAETKTISVSATETTTIAKPTITSTTAANAHGDILGVKCSTETLANEMTYRFYKDNVSVMDYSPRSEMNEFIRAGTTEFKCQAKAGTVTSSQSDELRITAVAGKPCNSKTANIDCSGKGYDGTCTSDRCVCSSPHFVHLRGCAVGKTCTPATAQTDCDGAAYTKTCSNYLCVCSSKHYASATTCTRVGKPCTASTATVDCEGKEYTGTCTAQRCVCGSSYVAAGDECKSGAARLITSFLTVAVAVTMARLV